MTDGTIEQNLLVEDDSRKAFAHFYETYQRRVFSIALNFFGGKREIAEDVTQQIFLKIFDRQKDFRGEAELTTWIYRVTINACIDEQRKTRRFFSLESFFEKASGEKAINEKFERREISDAVCQAVGELKIKFRLPIVLKYSEGLSYEEIAEVLDCSIGTISSRLNRGHKMLARKLAHLKDKI